MASKVATMVGAPPPPSVLAPRAKGLVDAIALLEMGHRKALADIELVLEAGAVSLLGRAAVAAAAAAGDLEEGEPHATHAFLRKMHPALERLRTDLQARRAAVGALEAEYAAAVAVATAAAGGRGGGGATQKEERKGTDGPAADSLAAHMATLSGWLRGHVAGNITPPPGALPAEVALAAIKAVPAGTGDGEGGEFGDPGLRTLLILGVRAAKMRGGAERLAAVERGVLVRPADGSMGDPALGVLRFTLEQRAAATASFEAKLLPEVAALAGEVQQAAENTEVAVAAVAGGALAVDLAALREMVAVRAAAAAGGDDTVKTKKAE